MKNDLVNSKENPFFVSAEVAVEAFGNGEILIVSDDEDRENEGDFVMAAEHVTPAAINFMARQGCGLICVALTAHRAAALELPPMVAENNALMETAFTVSVDARYRNSTGISARDRSETIKVLVEENSTPDDLARPGHIFPLIAKAGGVLERPGHTEAVVDLARLAGLKPAGILCEILDEDGSMARMPALIKIAEKFDLKMTSVAELRRYCSHLVSGHGDADALQKNTSDLRAAVLK